jgi:predicted nucleotide-binding protein
MVKKAIQFVKPEVTVLKKSKYIFKNELEQRIALGQELSDRQVLNTEQLEKLKKDYYSWEDFNQELLRRSFNNLQNEYLNDYKNSTNMIGVDDVIYRRDRSSGEYKLNHEKQKINASVTNLERLVEKLPLIDELENIQTYGPSKRTFTKECFVVHGHDHSKKNEVARFVENDLGKRAIILHEQANKGRTIIEKFEDFSKVDFAVALWTADDEGKAKLETNLKDRTRQNVILETGFFIGKLGRENVIVLHDEGVEIPSDYSGVVFIPLVGNWKDDLRREVDAIYNL